MTPQPPPTAPAYPADPWTQFVAAARATRSAEELLAVVLQRPVLARCISNAVFPVSRPLPPLRLVPSRPPQPPIRMLEHLLLDSAPPYPPLASSSAVVVRDRLPVPLRAAARRGQEPPAAMLERSRAYWTAEILQLDAVGAADASWDTGLAPGVPMLRATRVLQHFGVPVALVVEEIPLPAGRGPPLPP